MFSSQQNGISSSDDVDSASAAFVHAVNVGAADVTLTAVHDFCDNNKMISLV